MVSTKAIAAIALTLMVACPIGLGYILSYDEEETTSWETTEQYNISDYLLNSDTPYYQTYAGPNNNEIVGGTYVDVSTTATSTPIYERTAQSMTLTTSYSAIPNFASYSFSFSMDSVGVRVTLKDDTYQVVNILGSSPSAYIHKDLLGNVTISQEDMGGNETVQTFSGTKKVELKLTAGTGTTPYYAWIPTGTYAEVSAGWIPSSEGTTVRNGWDNGSLVFSVDFRENSNLRIMMPYGSGGELTAINFCIQVTDGMMYYGAGYSDLTLLGKYTKARITITAEECTIEGIAAWSSLGTSPTALNSATVSHTKLTELRSVIFHDTSGHDVRIRCDSAEIPAGSFPSTKDFDLSLSDLFPDSMMSIKLSSIGIYGDSLQVGDDTYDITDGRITVDGKKVSLKGALISFLPNEDDELVGSINGRELGTFDELPTITFGGEWSLTAIAYKVEEVSTTNMTWNAGGFGLDKEGFAAAGLITAGAVFVALGMQGRASGTKIGLLLLMCGGAAFAYFSFL